ncbi:Abi-like protein [[Clostridium] polysaccharolyticum]|uniref:Abi-like protein n=1 Tax=[Clostridium] polysaccharolyticum TaxID=29364 RepID=A0A1I0CS64_9FIRM|nr:Abi-like protein [[Clostridium] polysaccharolyticum]
MGYEKTDALMRHLRDSGIAIGGSEQKRQLINTGYFHGYKGYRFFGNNQRRLPFTSYNEVYATIQYDSDLKALLYGKMMYIETAVKNIALESILVNADSESIQSSLANAYKKNNLKITHFYNSVGYSDVPI